MTGLTLPLASFQQAFVAALADPDAPCPAARHPAFAIYRNTVMRGCLDALEANYPAVVCLVGREWFRAAAAIHVEAHPPIDGRLVVYGESFADFLSGFAPAAELPYLADIARLDRAWTESHVAADAATLDVAGLRELAPDAIAALVLRPHPATRFVASPWPLLSIWEASREGQAVDDHLAWKAEVAMVTRPGNEVSVAATTDAACRLLTTCAAGVPLGMAAEQTQQAYPDMAIDPLLAGLLRAGAFASL